jgi:hypothetical protein
MFTLFDAFYDKLIDSIPESIANKTQEKILSYIKHITYNKTELDKDAVFDILKNTDDYTTIIEGIEFWSDDFKIETITIGDKYDYNMSYTDFISMSIKKPEIKRTNMPENLRYTMLFTTKDGHITAVPEGETTEL